jgi:hypothetical protein
MKKMWQKYSDWSIRQAKSAQCSPALVLLGVAVVLAAVAYVYRHLIIETLEWMGLGIVALLVTYIGVRLAAIAFRSHKHRVQRLHAAGVATRQEAREQEPWQPKYDSPTLKEMASISGDLAKITQADQLRMTEEGDIEVIKMKRKASKA